MRVKTASPQLWRFLSLEEAVPAHPNLFIPKLMFVDRGRGE